MQVLNDFGYNENLEGFKKQENLESFDVGRVLIEHKERYIVITEKGEYEAEITGNLRFTAHGREDFPAVGDWVALTVFEPNFAVIHRIFPRSSVLKRRAAGASSEVQIIATNIDVAFIMQAVDRDFSINRLERYITICNSANVKPIIILTKADLANQEYVTQLLEKIKHRVKDHDVIAISNLTGFGYESINKIIEKGKTYCMLGSSGVGKSTLMNKLAGKDLMKTDCISTSTNRGKHITSHRELILLENGGLLIDNPGMREVGIADSEGGIETTFEKIENLAGECKFKDCTHISETGCSVLRALEEGEIEMELYENYLKMMKEKAHFETSLAEKKKKEKMFGKILKNYKKDMKKNDL